MTNPRASWMLQAEVKATKAKEGKPATPAQPKIEPKPPAPPPAPATAEEKDADPKRVELETYPDPVLRAKLKAKDQTLTDQDVGTMTREELLTALLK